MTKLIPIKNLLRTIFVFSLALSINSTLARTKAQRLEDDYKDAKRALDKAEKNLKDAKKKISDAKATITTDIKSVQSRIKSNSSKFSANFVALFESSYTQDGGPICTTVSTINSLFNNIVTALTSRAFEKIHDIICENVVPCQEIAKKINDAAELAHITPSDPPPAQANFENFVSIYNNATGSSIQPPYFSTYPPSAQDIAAYLNSLLVTMVVNAIDGIISDSTPTWSTLTTNCGNLSNDEGLIANLETTLKNVQAKRDHACRSWHAEVGPVASCKK